MLAQYETWSCQRGAACYETDGTPRCAGEVAACMTPERKKPLQSTVLLQSNAQSEVH